MAPPKKTTEPKKVVKATKADKPKKAAATKTDKAPRTEPLSLSTYIVKASKAGNNGVGVRKNLKEHLEQLLLTFIRHVNIHAEESMKADKRKTLQERDIKAAVEAFVSHGDFRNALLERGTNGIENSKELNMSVARTREWLVHGLSDKDTVRVGKDAVSYLTGVLEQVVVELTKVSNVNERPNITLPDFQKVAKKTEWLSEFLGKLGNNVLNCERECNDCEEENKDCDDCEKCPETTEEPPKVELKKVSKRASASNKEKEPVPEKKAAKKKQK